MVQHFFYFPLESATEKKLSQLVGDRQTGELPTFGGVPTPLPEQVSDPFKYRESPEPVGFIGPPIPTGFEFPTGFDLPTGFPLAQPGPVQFQESIQVQSTADALRELTAPWDKGPPAAGSVMDILGWRDTPGPVQPPARSENPLIDIGLGMVQVINPFLDFTYEPIEVFAQTGAELVSQVPKLARTEFSQLEAPTLFTEGYPAALESFRARSLLAQMALSVVFDPFILASILKIPLRGSVASMRSAVRVQVAHAAGNEFGEDVINEVTEELVDRLGSATGQIPPSGRVLRPGEIAEQGPVPEARMRRQKEAEEFGLNLDSSANEFIPSPRPFDDVLEEVVTTENTAVKAAIATTGINPSIAKNTQVGRALTAYQTQKVTIEYLNEVALAAAYDSHFGGPMTGAMPGIKSRLGDTSQLLPIDKDGFFGDTGKLWQDVFEKPDAFDLSKLPNPEATRALIDDYNMIENFEIPRLLDDAGITQRIRSRPDGEYYVFRNVNEIRGIEVRRHSNPLLQRHYDEATEGFQQGIRYDIDPRASLELHIAWAYRKVVRKQLNDALEEYSVSPHAFIPKAINDAYLVTIRTVRDLEKLLKGFRGLIHTTEGHRRVTRAVSGGRERAVRLNESDIQALDQRIQDIDVLPLERETQATQRYGITPAGETTVDIIGPRGARKRGRIVTPRVRAIAKATEARNQYDKLIKREASQSTRLRTVQHRLNRLESRISLMKDFVEGLDEALALARLERRRAGADYTNALELARARETALITEAPIFFGPGQPNEIPVALWKEGNNRFFPSGDVDLIKKELTLQGIDTFGAKALKGLEILGNTVRFLSTVGDWALPFLNLLPVLGENPNAWARTSLRHYQAFLDPTVQSRLIRENIEDFQWLALHGVPVGDPEFFKLLKPGQGISVEFLASRLPKGEEVRRLLQQAGKQTFGRFQASYNTGLGWSRALLRQSLKDSWTGTDAELARYIRNLTGGLDSRALGVGPTQRAAEGMWLAFSPRLLRSTIALTIDAMKPGVVGNKSRLALARLATAVTSVYVVTGLAMRMDWEEIQAGLNPLNGKRYLSHFIGGDWIGVGGQVRSISQTLGKIVADPQNLISWDTYDNPVINFIQGRGAVTRSQALALLEVTTGKDFLPFEEIDGPLDLAKFIGTSLLPFVAQGKIEGEGMEALIAAEAGARTSPETPTEARNAMREIVKDRLVAEGVLPLEAAEQSNRRSPWLNKVSNPIDADYLAIIDKQPEMQPLVQEVKDVQTKRRAPVQIMMNDLDAIDAHWDTELDALIASVSPDNPGKLFRTVHANIQRQRAEQKEYKRNSPLHSEAMKILSELEPSEAKFQIALSAYMRALNWVEGDPPELRLEDPLTGEYDFDLREVIIDRVKGEHGEDMITRVETHIRSNERPLATELRQDRETLKRYWEKPIEMVEKYDLSPRDIEVWREYRDMPEGMDKQLFKEQNVRVIRAAEREVGEYRNIIQQEPGIDLLLLKWGYDVTPETVEGSRFFYEQTREGAGGAAAPVPPVPAALPVGGMAPNAR